MAKTYTIKATDNLLELSKKFQSSPSSILKANGLKTLTPGQTIQIPFQRAPAYGGSYNPTVPQNQTSGGRRGNTRYVHTPAPSAWQQIVNTYSSPNLMNVFSPTPQGNGGRRGSPNTIGVYGTAGYWGQYQPEFQPYNPTQNIMGTVGSFLENTLPYATPKAPYYSATSYMNPNIRPVQTGGNLSPDSGFLPVVRTGGSLSPDTRGGGLYLPQSTAFTGAMTSDGFRTPTSSTPNTRVTIGGSLSPDVGGGFTPTTPPVQPDLQPTSGNSPGNLYGAYVHTKETGRAQFLSGNGIDPISGYVPTRADVWNMKANARRKAGSKAGAEGERGDRQTSTAVGWGNGRDVVEESVIAEPPPLMDNWGNQVSNAVSWRV